MSIPPVSVASTLPQGERALRRDYREDKREAKRGALRQQGTSPIGCDQFKLEIRCDRVSRDPRTRAAKTTPPPPDNDDPSPRRRRTMSDYKASKEAFVSGMTGSSITHINIISAVALVCLPPLPTYTFQCCLTRVPLSLLSPYTQP